MFWTNILAEINTRAKYPEGSNKRAISNNTDLFVGAHCLKWFMSTFREKESSIGLQVNPGVEMVSESWSNLISLADSEQSSSKLLAHLLN